MRLENDIKLDYSDVLIRPKRSQLSSRKDVNLSRTFGFSDEWDWTGVPIMAANMDGVGTFEMADALREQSLFTCLVKTYSAEEIINFFKEIPHRADLTAVSLGTNTKDVERFDEVYTNVDVKFACIDVANGYSEHFLDFVKKFKQKYPNVVVIAGNVVTADQTQELILNGADIVKVGIGPGSVCTTRIQTGVGYPQLSAVIECADAAHGLGGYVIADGGCTCAGDVAKAFAGGADFVMLGGMLAGHDEGGGEVITKYKKTGYCNHNGDDILKKEEFVSFYGMSSDAANTKHFGGLKDYRSSEGREVLVPYRHGVSATVQKILGGIRSTCTYTGAHYIKHLPKCATFIRVNNQYNAKYESTTTKM